MWWVSGVDWGRIPGIVTRNHLVLWLPSVHAGAGLWSTGYFPGYRQSSMPASSVDLTALTYVIHFSVAPNSAKTGTATSQVFGKAAGIVNVFGRLSTFAFPRHFRFC
jgi:hypothetical protein